MRDVDLITNEDTHGATMLVWLFDRFGPEALNWHPAVIRQEIAQTVGTTPNDLVFDKLMAAITIVTTDLFFKSADAFQVIASAITGGGFSPDQFDPPDAAECAWAVTEAMLLDPQDDNPEPFSLDVCRLIGRILRNEGYLSPPDVLRIAIGPEDDSGRLREDYGDDPETLAMIQAGQEQKNQEINETIKDGLSSLLQQIESLTLITGNGRGFASKLRSVLASPAETP